MVACRGCCWFWRLRIQSIIWPFLFHFCYFPGIGSWLHYASVTTSFPCTTIFCMLASILFNQWAPERFTCCWFIGNNCRRALFRHNNNIWWRVCLGILKSWPWNSLSFHCSWAGWGSKFKMKLFFHIFISPGSLDHYLISETCIASFFDEWILCGSKAGRSPFFIYVYIFSLNGLAIYVKMVCDTWHRWLWVIIES